MLKQELLLKQDQITGFSLSFAKALLARLCQLYYVDKLWTYREGQGGKQEVSEQTTLAQNLLHYLDDQIPYSNWEDFNPNVSGFSRKKCGRVLVDAENFLKTFDPNFELKIK